MQTLRSRLRQSVMVSLAFVCACEPAPSSPTLTSLPGPRYSGHGGGGTISAALQVNGLLTNGNSCIGDDAVTSGLVNGVKDASDVKCTSNDITLNSIVLTEFSFDGVTFHSVEPGQPVSCQRGSTIFVHMFGILAQNANSTRTDVGLWVSWDGGDGVAGSCQHYSLRPGTEIGIFDSDSDLCGDFAPNTSIGIPFDVLALRCEDNGSGFMNVGTCIGWKNPGADGVCPVVSSSPAQGFRFGTLPGQKSKCNCSSVQLPVVLTG